MTKVKQLSTLQRMRLLKAFLNDVVGLSNELVENYNEQLQALQQQRKQEVISMKNLREVLI